MFERLGDREEQAEFWIQRSQIAPPRTKGFYGKLNERLVAMGFAKRVWEVCEPSCRDASCGGRPGIDPVVYFKMLMVGFFENLPSERAIAARCEDSLAIREFLGYGLETRTPEHSSLTVIRQRLGAEVYQEVFTIVLAALREHGLLKGKNLGIDSSVIEANASLRSLEHRNTEQSYWEYVKSLAADKGYFAAGEITLLQEWDLRTVVSDRQAGKRRKEKYTSQQWRAIRRAKRSVQSASGKALLRKRGMHLERAFEHILDEGGLRRATLRGRDNLTKRYRVGAACYNLSLLLRALCGIGTAKQWAIKAFPALYLLLRGRLCTNCAPVVALRDFLLNCSHVFKVFCHQLIFTPRREFAGFSTVC